MAEQEFKFIGVEKPEDIRICVYTILKSEMKFIDRFLESVKDACGIYLLDTGSTDGSYEYLCELAEKPEWKGKLFVEQKIYKPFRFDVSRTDNMRMIPPPEEGGPHCCFQVDLDEVLSPGWLPDFQKVCFEHPDFDRLNYLYAWNHDEDGNPGRVFYYNKFHHNHIGYATIRPVHEFIEWVSEEPCPFHGSYRVSDTKIYKHHYPDQTKSRSSYLPLLELRAKENPDELTGLCYLLREYQFNNRYDDSLKVAITVYIKAQKWARNETGLLCNIAKELAVDFDKVGCADEAEFFYKKALEYEPRLKDSYMQYGQLLAYHGRPLEALKVLEESKQKARRLYDWRELDYMWSEWKEAQLRADCYCWLGDYDLAWKTIREGAKYIRLPKDVTESGYEGFAGDYNFCKGKYQERHPDEVIEDTLKIPQKN